MKYAVIWKGPNNDSTCCVEYENHDDAMRALAKLQRSGDLARTDWDVSPRIIPQRETEQLRGALRMRGRGESAEVRG